VSHGSRRGLQISCRSAVESLCADCQLLTAYWFDMARISGLDRNQAPWHLRWFYRVMRRMFGKDLTPVKIQMRVPGIVWGSIGMEAGLGRKRRVSLRFIQLAKVRTAARIG